jgi:hypothetical protein
MPYTNLTFIGCWINALALKYEYAEPHFRKSAVGRRRVLLIGTAALSPRELLSSSWLADSLKLTRFRCQSLKVAAGWVIWCVSLLGVSSRLTQIYHHEGFPPTVRRRLINLTHVPSKKRRVPLSAHAQMFDWRPQSNRSAVNFNFDLFGILESDKSLC